MEIKRAFVNLLVEFDDADERDSVLARETENGIDFRVIDDRKIGGKHMLTIFARHGDAPAPWEKI